MYRNHGCLHNFNFTNGTIPAWYLTWCFSPKDHSSVNWQNLLKQVLKIWKNLNIKKYSKQEEWKHSSKLDSQLLPSYQYCITTTKIHMALSSICRDSKNHHPKEECNPHILVRLYWKKSPREKNLKTKMCLNSKRERHSFIRSKHGSSCQRKASTREKTKTQGKSNGSHREKTRGLLRKC